MNLKDILKTKTIEAEIKCISDSEMEKKTFKLKNNKLAKNIYRYGYTKLIIFK